MPACLLQLHPEIDRLVTITNKPQTLSTLEVEACRATKSCSSRWQQVHSQLHSLQSSTSVSASQKLQLASCERFFLAFYSGFRNHENTFRSALSLLSHQDLEVSLNLLASSAKCCASAGDFGQAVGKLNQALEWGWPHASKAQFFHVFSAAVFTCNRMGLHQHAVKNAEHCFAIAKEERNEIQLQLAQFKHLNSSRLAGVALESGAYASQLLLLEKNQLQYDGMYQFLLPVYAALAALDQKQPDCRSACHSLAMATEQIADANDYGVAQYLLALARYHLAFGRTQEAKNALIEADLVLTEADVSLTKRIRSTLIRLGLDLPLNTNPSPIPASKKTWAKFIRLSETVIAG